MGAVQVVPQCAQCGRDVPIDARELADWRHGELALEADLDDVRAGMIVCPDCDADDLRDFDQGEPG